MAPRRFTVPDQPRQAQQFAIDYRLRKPRPDGLDPDAPDEWEDHSAEFTTVTMPSAGAQLDFAAYIGRTTIPVDALMDWFDACLPDPELARFHLLIHDKDVALPIETLGEVATWLSEVFGERPTQPPVPSPSGSGEPGSGPTVPAASEA